MTSLAPRDESDGWSADAALDADYMARIFASFYTLCIVCGVGYQLIFN